MKTTRRQFLSTTAAGLGLAATGVSLGSAVFAATPAPLPKTSPAFFPRRWNWPHWAR